MSNNKNVSLGSQGQNFYQSGTFGIGYMTGGVIKGGAKVAGVINEAPQKSIVEVATEIQDLLKQLEQSYPTTTIPEQITLAGEAVKQIEANPTLKQRLINAGKEGGLALMEKSFDNVIGATILGAVKGWIEAEAK